MGNNVYGLFFMFYSSPQSTQVEPIGLWALS